MLTPDLSRIAITDKSSTSFQQNWSVLRENALELISHRISTADKGWYQRCWKDVGNAIISADELQDSRSVNQFPKGLIGEVLFLDACRQAGVSCEITDGKEDVWGADFRISYEGEERYADVTTNISTSAFRKKINEGSFPTLFLPWEDNIKSIFEPRVPSNNLSYIEKFLLEGIFDGREYLRTVLHINYEVLNEVRRYVWRYLPPNHRIYSTYEFSFQRPGVQYVRNLEGVLLLIRRSLGKV